jgi:hypothetical protein
MTHLKVFRVPVCKRDWLAELEVGRELPREGVFKTWRDEVAFPAVCCSLEVLIGSMRSELTVVRPTLLAVED